MAISNEKDGSFLRRISFNRLIDACKRKDLSTITDCIEGRPELLLHHDKHKRSMLHYLAILVLDDGAKAEEASGELCTSLQGQQLDSVKCFEYVKSIIADQLSSEEAESFWCQVDLDGLNVLHFSVISSNHLLVEYLLSSNFNAPIGREDCLDEKSNFRFAEKLINSFDSEHHTPLHWAVITNDLHCVRLLVEHSGVRLVRVCDENGATPLHYSTQVKDYPKYRAQLRQMLKHASASHSSSMIEQQRRDNCVGQNDNQTHSNQQISGNHRASLPKQSSTTTTASNGCGISTNKENSLEVLEFLVSLDGINLECLDNDRRTPLLWAASSGNWEAIMLLAKSGANLMARDASSLNALHCSASHGFTECLESLLKLAKTLIATPQQETSSSSVSMEKSSSGWVNQADNLNCTPLFYAILSGNIDCVELLLEHGANFDWQDSKGRTVAHFAALKGQLNSLKLLESVGANLWMATKQGDLPLHYAIKSGRQQVIAWLLSRSPYEKAVNAINNIGRAPIHLAVTRNNPSLAEWLIDKCGANVNQLVKVRERSLAPGRPNQPLAAGLHRSDVSTPSAPMYKYETALDMARRLAHWSCVQLLESRGAQTAAVLTSQRQRQMIGNQAAATGYLSHTNSSSTSAEPQLTELPRVAEFRMGDQGQQKTKGIPKIPARPQALESEIPPTSDISQAASGSSSLSQSSTTSVRAPLARQAINLPPLLPGDKQANQATTSEGKRRKLFATSMESNIAQDEPSVTRPSEDRNLDGRPYKGGISYNNDHINASIKCKLYSNSEQKNINGDLHQHSFPPLSSESRSAGRGQRERRSVGHSMGSLERIASTSARATSGPAPICGQEIITNVNVYTSPCPNHCRAAASHKDEQERSGQCCRGVQDLRSKGPAKRQLAVSASDTDSDATTSGSSVVVAAKRNEEEEEDRPSSWSEAEESARGEDQAGGWQRATPNESRQAATRVQTGHRPITGHPTSIRDGGGGTDFGAYEHRLPVIMSAAEEERSTSGETVAEATHLQQPPEDKIAHGDQAGNRATQKDKLPADMDVASTKVGAKSRQMDLDQVRSPVAEYMNAKYHELDHFSRHSESLAHEISQQSHLKQGQSPQRVMDYSHVKARVDSHRNDSGLSSGFGFAPSATNGDSLVDQSPCSTHKSARYHPMNATSLRHQYANDMISSPSRLPRLNKPTGTPTRSKRTANQHGAKEEHYHQGIQHGDHHHHYDNYDHHHGRSRSCSRQTIIKTRRLSVDSEELASRVEKSIRKYKQETKLFEELQNLKRSQIRSGRANEALLVKRLVEHFKHDTLDYILGLDNYSGPYTYKAYELYLYDQLRKLSQSNQAKLDGNKLEHKYHYSTGPHKLPNEFELHSNSDEMVPEVRDYLEEDMRAEMELQQVMNRQGSSENVAAPLEQKAGETVAIEPSGALEEIRVKQKEEDGSLLRISRQTDTATDEKEEQKTADLQLEETGGDETAPLSTSDRENDDLVAKEQNELAVESLDKGAQNEAGELGSLSSSRRSSVEIEKMKLDELPLRVGLGPSEAEADAEPLQQKERVEDSLLGEEASSLSSAIITDVLGNVSRVGSPIREDTIKREAAAAEEGEDSEAEHQQESKSSLVEQKQESGQQEPETSESDSVECPRPSPSGSRRRSVVNIGNKMEVIYHNVGIEIEPVAEGDHHDEREEERDQPPSGEVPLSEPESTNDAAQTLEEEGSTSCQDGQQEECTSLASTAQPSELQEDSKSVDDEKADSVERGRPMNPSQHEDCAEERNKVERLGQTARAHPLSLRRASSPKSLQLKDDASLHRDDFRLRRSSADDRLQGARKKLEGQWSEKGPETDGDSPSGSPHKEGQSTPKTSKVSRQESLKSIVSDNKAQPATSRHSPTFRRHLKRSLPPKRRYCVDVSIDDIRARWNPIKQRERLRKKELNDLDRDTIRVASKRALSSDDAPQESIVEPLVQDRLDDIELIYELNKKLMPTDTHEQQVLQARRVIQSSSQFWCQRKITRLIDVRTLKRTLSLPESIMYSNELLKKFNVLKI